MKLKKFIQYLEYNFLQNYKDSLKLEDKLRLDKIIMKMNMKKFITY